MHFTVLHYAGGFWDAGGFRAAQRRRRARAEGATRHIGLSFMATRGALLASEIT